MCVFCNQHSISGVDRFESGSVLLEIENALSTIDKENTEVELAFFGGSFTGIDRSLMTELLVIGRDLLEKGCIDSIRCSTRPDYINEEILALLKEYGMRTIELGIQSMDDNVLLMSRRGHSSDVTRNACTMIVDAGFDLVGQMMIGLPGSSAESELRCARFIVESGATAARVYPTVVFHDTELCSMSMSGDYFPLDLEDAVCRTRDVLDVFDKNNIKVIRVGLCASENLSDSSRVFGGANDAAIGEMAMSALYLKRICALLDKMTDTEGKELLINGCPGAVSKISGHKKQNKKIIFEKYGIKSIRILENKDLIGYNIVLNLVDRSSKK